MQKIRKWLRILPLIYIKSLKLHVYQGGWELDESVEEAASRESLEEAGVLGNVEVGVLLPVANYLCSFPPCFLTLCAGFMFLNKFLIWIHIHGRMNWANGTF